MEPSDKVIQADTGIMVLDQDFQTQVVVVVARITEVVVVVAQDQKV
jgi:hypothetical protein